MWLFGISEISFCGDGDGQTNSLINDSTGEPPYRNAPPVREGVVANIESEPSALEERTEELIITTLQERKGALGDGQEVSEVHKALEMDFQIETIADEFTLIKKMEKENHKNDHNNEATNSLFNEIRDYESKMEMEEKHESNSAKRGRSNESQRRSKWFFRDRNQGPSRENTGGKFRILHQELIDKRMTFLVGYFDLV